MTMPEPENPQSKIVDMVKPLIEGFNKLPALLSYGGLILIVALVISLSGGGLPNILLAVPIIVIAAYLVDKLGMRWLDLQDKKLDRQSEETPSPEQSEPVENPPKNGADDVSSKEWERRYLDHLMGVCGYPPSMALVDIKEAGLGGQKLALERIFTSLDVPAPQKGRDPSQLAINLEKLEQGEQLKREPSLAAISRAKNKKLIILGAPGSGKSTLVNYLTLCLAGDRLAGEHGAGIAVTQDHLRQHGWELGHLRLWPVRVILREYAARGLSQGQSIWEFIAADLSRPAIGLAGYAPLLKKRLQEDGGILLLDGLDEVDKATAAREALKTNIERFAREFRRVRVLVTSRLYAYGSGWELRGFQVTRLLDFSDEQIQFFIEQWYTVMGQQDPTLGPETAQVYNQSLTRQIEQIANLREMARHPLLLTMMVYIHRGREGGALPQRREELYRLSVILLLDLWRRSKLIPGQETQTLGDELGMDTERLLKALAEVAFVAHRDQPEQAQTADISGALLAGLLHKHKSKESDVDLDDVIEYVRDRAGLLEDHGRNADDTDDVYRFPHRTFQEYLAAVHLLDAMDFPKELVALARENPAHWREVVLLAGAAARPVMQWGLVEALYGNKAPSPDRAAAEADWWGAFLAGQLIAENNLHSDPDAPREKLSRVQAWHKAIAMQGALPPRDRAAAGRVLAQLGDPRPGVGVDPETGLPDIGWGNEVPAGAYRIGDDEGDSGEKPRPAPIETPFRLSRYPITNAQFQCFVAAPDWDNLNWWRDIPDEEMKFSEPRFPYANHPRETVSWYQAVAFCRWLSHKLGDQLGAEMEIRLPHEVEWEVAARWNGKNSDGRAYPWGGEFDKEKANTNEGGIGQTTAVGLYPTGKNEALNLYDLSGNVWEWCRNKYDNSDDEEVDDSGVWRVLRGGSWAYPDYGARAAYRDAYPPRQPSQLCRLPGGGGASFPISSRPLITVSSAGER